MSSSLTSDGSGPFLATSEIFPKEEEQFNVKITQIYQNLASKINIKDIALYEASLELPDGQQFFSNDPQVKRYGFRKVISTGALATGANTVAHGITLPTPNTYHFTRIYGVIENTATPLYVPIPNDTVLVTVDGTNINITIPAAYNGYSGIVVLEYVKTDP